MATSVGFYLLFSVFAGLLLVAFSGGDGLSLIEDACESDRISEEGRIVAYVLISLAWPFTLMAGALVAMYYIIVIGVRGVYSLLNLILRRKIIPQARVVKS